MRVRQEKTFYLSAELGNGKLMRWRVIRRLAGNRSYGEEILFTNIRVIYLGGRGLQIIDFHGKNYKNSIISLKTRKEMLGTNTVKRWSMESLKEEEMMGVCAGVMLLPSVISLAWNIIELGNRNPERLQQK